MRSVDVTSICNFIWSVYLAAKSARKRCDYSDRQTMHKSRFALPENSGYFTLQEFN